ncbi:MAG: sialidase family protein [Candidatus Omnitrophota bacterium]
MEILERYVAVDNKCAWPNLTLMPDGALVATIFGEPTHGRWEGDAECWVSRDDGRVWSFLGVPAPHKKGTNRMNVAAGLTRSGVFVVLCSGYTNIPPRPPLGEPGELYEGTGLEPWVCRSEDGGKSWTQTRGLTIPSQLSHAVPFGDIIQLTDNHLAVSCYSLHSDDKDRCSAWIFFSEDDGRTWGNSCPIAVGNYDETGLLYLGDGRLLAASRTNCPHPLLEIFVSEDNGQTWTCRGPVSLPGQIPAHLCRLKDGRILLSYGVRNPGMLGVCARVSCDGSLTWSAPLVLFSTDYVDGGYPSSVQMGDGTIVTAYYCASIPMHRRYHMGIVRWKLD